MIYWVDEDSPQFDFDRERIRARGFEVSAVLDATSAYRELEFVDLSQITGVIVDVMLRPGQDKTRFSAERCDGNRRVGLVLIDDLIKVWGGDGGKKFIIYTCATAEDIRVAIRASQKRYGIPVLPKSTEIVGTRFVGLVTEYFRSGVIDDEFVRR